MGNNTNRQGPHEGVRPPADDPYKRIFGVLGPGVENVEKRMEPSKPNKNETIERLRDERDSARSELQATRERLEARVSDWESAHQAQKERADYLQSEVERLTEIELDAKIRLDERSRWIDELRQQLQAAQAEADREWQRHQETWKMTKTLATERDELKAQLAAAQEQVRDYEKAWEAVRSVYEHMFPDRPWNSCPPEQRTLMLLVEFEEQVREKDSEIERLNGMREQLVNLNKYEVERIGELTEQLATSQREVTETQLKWQRDRERLQAENAELKQELSSVQKALMERDDYLKAEFEKMLPEEMRKLQASLDEATALLKTEQEESQRWREVSQKLGSCFYDARGLLGWAQKAWDDKDGKLVSHYPSGSGWKRKVDAFLAAQPQDGGGDAK